MIERSPNKFGRIGIDVKTYLILGAFICIYVGNLFESEEGNKQGQNFGDEYFADLDLIDTCERQKVGSASWRLAVTGQEGYRQVTQLTFRKGAWKWHYWHSGYVIDIKERYSQVAPTTTNKGAYLFARALKGSSKCRN